MISLFKKMDPVYRKVPGGYFALAGSLTFIGLLITAIILHSLTKPVSWFQQFMSNLGIGPNGSNVVFNSACVLEVICLVPFMIRISRQLWMESGNRMRLNNLLITVGFIIAMVAFAGLIILATFPMGPTTIVFHAIGAMSFFFGTIFFGALYWLSFELQKKSTWMLRLTTGSVFGFFIAFIVATMVTMVENPGVAQAFFADPMTGIANILANDWDPRLMWVRFNEWWYILTMIGWSFYLGMLSIKLSRAEKKVA